METTNLNKNITTVLQQKYIVPLYQRNFAWGEEEISQLLQDIYESWSKNPDGNYYIGSLVVIKRKNGDYEVIDGQQRLTAITLVSKILKPEIKEPKLFYDSRPEVEAFYSSFYQTGNTNDVTFDYKVSHLINAVDFIKEAKLNSDDNNKITIANLNDDFKKFFFEQVILVFVELPQDTDVANYFEIMNNRGQQLQKHEILKAKLLDKIKDEQGNHDKAKRKIYSKIWDSCSQMNTHIQKLFDINYRKTLFGEEYSDFPNKEKIIQLIPNNADNQTNNASTRQTINSILLQEISNENKYANAEIEDVDDDGDDKSIIDFPNFLMHILKLKYDTIYKDTTKTDRSDGQNISLNEKYLLDVYEKIKDKVVAEDFISDLLFYKTIFDRYIVKSTTDENSEDKFEWTLEKPYKYTYEARNSTSLKYKNTFDEKQERLVKCLSMLQVTFRTRINKNWLQEVLGWFPLNSEEEYIKKLDDFISKYYDNLQLSINRIENGNTDFYHNGTDTPHFFFNFIDYLYWVESKNDAIKPQFKFDFRYRNSVEHHRPQSRKDSVDDKLIDCLGNLCLVSKSSNSRMNNEEPVGKAKAYYSNNLPPKRKVIYDLTNDKHNWGKTEIEQHYNDVIDLINKRSAILKQ
ncbi:MAG: DUF262 domain-containing HNH endonuclease family protein [Prevotellaceae bacterium]|jgi:uncharacterized protein with ParB-like and HNH nuclease domain|nr:DUF262 domain-containing HNH endonuclease family protein [Prevotellaceae bacterium]